MQDFLTSIIKNIVHNPDQVVVTESKQDDRIVFTISVAPEDMGRVIGKQGKVINAVRLIMRVIAIRDDVRIRIDIKDENEQTSVAQSQPATEATEAITPEIEITPEISSPTSQAPADFVGQPTTILDNSDTKN